MTPTNAESDCWVLHQHVVCGGEIPQVGRAIQLASIIGACMARPGFIRQSDASESEMRRAPLKDS